MEDHRPRRSEFAERYSTESLFVTADEDPTELLDTDPVEASGPSIASTYYDPADPWAVLGLDAGAGWTEIVAAHRRLAMEHHPDRLLAAHPADRERSEQRMREANIAYCTLRRQFGR